MSVACPGRDVPAFRQARVCACGDHGFIGLTQGFVALFDVDKLPLIAGRLWSIIRPKPGFIYARSHRGGGVDLMHRIVTGASDRSVVVDHRNHRGLDNQGANLRAASQGQNLCNQRSKGSAGTQFKGLTRSGCRFEARITREGQNITLGIFTTPEEAARAYDAAALRLHGEFALTNEAMGHFTQGSHT